MNKPDSYAAFYGRPNRMHVSDRGGFENRKGFQETHKAVMMTAEEKARYEDFRQAPEKKNAEEKKKHDRDAYRQIVSARHIRSPSHGIITSAGHIRKLSHRIIIISANFLSCIYISVHKFQDCPF